MQRTAAHKLLDLGLLVDLAIHGTRREDCNTEVTFSKPVEKTAL
jgi:hypothetical protein